MKKHINLSSWTLSITDWNNLNYVLGGIDEVYADVANVKGNYIKKSENLIILSDVTETTTNGITYKVENGVITINGTASANFYLGFAFDSVDTGTYSMSLFPTGTMSATNPWGVGESIGTLDFTISNTINNRTTNIDIKYLWRYISSGQTFNNYQIKPMLIKSSNAPTEFIVGSNTGLYIEDNINDELIPINNELVLLRRNINVINDNPNEDMR